MRKIRPRRKPQTMFTCQGGFSLKKSPRIGNVPQKFFSLQMMVSRKKSDTFQLQVSNHLTQIQLQTYFSLSFHSFKRVGVGNSQQTLVLFVQSSVMYLRRLLYNIYIMCCSYHVPFRYKNYQGRVRTPNVSLSFSILTESTKAKRTSPLNSSARILIAFTTYYDYQNCSILLCFLINAINQTSLQGSGPLKISLYISSVISRTSCSGNLPSSCIFESKKVSLSPRLIM